VRSGDPEGTEELGEVGNDDRLGRIEDVPRTCREATIEPMQPSFQPKPARSSRSMLPGRSSRTSTKSTDNVRAIVFATSSAGEFDRALTPEEIMDKLEKRFWPEGRKLFERFLRQVNKLPAQQQLEAQAQTGDNVSVKVTWRLSR
jgi:hypothetical protein